MGWVFLPESRLRSYRSEEAGFPSSSLLINEIPASFHMPGLRRNLVPSSETSGDSDMVDSNESSGPHCLPPLAHSQYYHLSVEKDGDEAAGSSPMAYGILDLCTGVGAQWFRVTEKYFAVGKQREYTPLGLVACIKMWPRNLLSFSHYHPLAFVTGSARHNHPGMARRSTSKLYEGAGTDHRSRLPRSAFCPLVPEPHKLWP